MLDPSKARSASPSGKLASEFTSGQLVIAICVFLVVALICFALGVVVGQHGDNSSPAMLARSPEALGPVASPDGQTGAQAPLQSPVTPQQRPPAPGFPSSPSTVGAAKTAQSVSELPAPAAAPPVTPPPPVETPQAEPPRSAESAQAPQPAPATPVVDAKPPEVAKGGPVLPAPGAPAAPVPPTPPVSAAPIAPLAEASPPVGASATAAAAPAQVAAGTGAYTVQVASFSGAKRKENAEAFRKRLEANAGLTADLAPSEDNKMIRVFVGGYPDRESARKACEELRKRAGFAGSFVKQR